MKIFVLSVGNRMPDWISAGCAEYTKRMPPELPVEFVNIKPEKRRAGRNTEQILVQESIRINAILLPEWRTIVLDERGTQLSTIKFSNVINEQIGTKRCIAFIIGGADGLHHDIKNKADDILALSTMTLPHGIVRVMLVEQLYRAASIIKRHPYHRW